MFEESFRLGLDYAAKSFGLTERDIMIKMAAENEIHDNLAIQKLFSSAGAHIMKEAGLQDSVECRILEKCAGYNVPLSEESRQAFIVPVQRVLEKYAGVSDAVSAFGGLSHTFALSTLTMGALGGASVWGLQRAGRMEDAETAAKFKQARKYKQLAREIRSQIAYEQKKLKNEEKMLVQNELHDKEKNKEYQF